MSNLGVLLLPIIILQYGLAIYALIKAIKQKEFNHLSKPTWIVIIILLNIIGPVLYLLLEGENN